jgi:hypothetical protein
MVDGWRLVQAALADLRLQVAGGAVTVVAEAPGEAADPLSLNQCDGDPGGVRRRAGAVARLALWRLNPR